MPVAPGEPLATVTADVVESAQRAVLMHDHNDRLVHEVVHDVVASFPELRHSASDVPDLRPHIVPLALHELPGVVPLAVKWIAPQEVITPGVNREGMKRWLRIDSSYRHQHPRAASNTTSPGLPAQLNVDESDCDTDRERVSDCLPIALSNPQSEVNTRR